MIHCVGEARTLLTSVFLSNGASDEEAEVFADVLIEAELRGRQTHGLNRAHGLVHLLRTRTPQRPEIIEERGPLLRIDGHDQSGYLVGAFAADEAVRVAHEQGHALAGVRNTRHCGMLGYYAWRIAQHDLIALLFADCAPLVAPWGATEGILGTNPIAAAFPPAASKSAFPVLIDMGTSAITFGAVKVARGKGAPLPEKAALDAKGRSVDSSGRTAI